MSKSRILVTDAEVRKSLAVVRGLGAKHEVVTAACSSPAIAAWSRYSQEHVRYSPDADFADWLMETVRRLAIDAVVCPQETTMAQAARVWDQLEAAGAKPTFPRADVLERVFDKAMTLRIAESVNVPIPRTMYLKDLDEADAAAEELGYPLVVKPRFSHYWNGRKFISGDGTRYASEPSDLVKIMEEHHSNQPAPLLQEYIPGKGLAVFLLLDKNGGICAEFAHRRIRDIRPTGSGSVLRESIAVEPVLRDRATALLRGMEWWGAAMVEFRTDERNNSVVLMEVNGRFWGSLQLALDSGVNFPDLLIDVVNGGTPMPPIFRTGVKVRWLLGDLARTVRVMQGRPTGYTGEFPSRWSALRDLFGRQPSGTIGEIFRRGDPLPAAAEVLSTLRSVL